MGKRNKSSNITTNDTAGIKGKEAMNKKIKFDESDDNTNKIQTNKSSSKAKQMNPKNTVVNEKECKKKNKKEDFDDNSEEVSLESENVSRQDTKPKDISQNHDEDVKDEDIDKFCDELSEEDNVQYENWVKLIEAKMHSNKKKPV